MDTFSVTVERANTASGYEWFLRVNGERVYTNVHRVGVFTDRSGTPAGVLPALLALALRGAW